MTLGMTCPHCGKGGALTLDSRARGDTVRRRRGCSHCGRRWSTYEIPARFFAELMRSRQVIAQIADSVAEMKRQMQEHGTHPPPMEGE